MATNISIHNGISEEYGLTEIDHCMIMVANPVEAEVSPQGYRSHRTFVVSLPETYNTNMATAAANTTALSTIPK